MNARKELLQRLRMARPQQEIDVVQEGAFHSPATEEAYQAVQSGVDSVWELGMRRTRDEREAVVALSGRGLYSPVNSQIDAAASMDAVPRWVLHTWLSFDDFRQGAWCRDEGDRDMLLASLVSLAAWAQRSQAEMRPDGASFVAKSFSRIFSRLNQLDMSASDRIVLTASLRLLESTLRVAGFSSENMTIARD